MAMRQFGLTQCVLSNVEVRVSEGNSRVDAAIHLHLACDARHFVLGDPELLPGEPLRLADSVEIGFDTSGRWQ